MTNTHTIIILFLLTVASFLVSETTAIAPLLLGLGGVKFLLVSFQFVEVKRAHLFWKALVLVFVLGTFGIFIMLTR